MSSYSNYMKSKKEKSMNFYFGEGNWKDGNKYFTYNPIINDDEVIIRTKNIKVWKVNPDYTVTYILMVDNNKAIYLKEWQVMPVAKWYEDLGETLRFNLVKLNRKYSKVYTFQKDFENMCFDKEYQGFDDLVALAKEQAQEEFWLKKDKEA